jgi:hypothetical protein
MHGLVVGDILVEAIGILHRAILHAGGAAGTLVFDDVARLFGQRDRKVACLSADTVDFGVGENFDVGMPADLDQFGREDSHGAVIGGIGLVKLGHMAANGRGLLDQINLITNFGKIKRGLNAADPSTDNHYISEIAVCKTFAKLFNLFFFQFLYPHFVAI